MTNTEVTNGQVDPAHYGPIGDAARHVASYCDGPARVHVYTVAFDTLTALAARLATVEQERDAAVACMDKYDLRLTHLELGRDAAIAEGERRATARIVTDLRGDTAQLIANTAFRCMEELADRYERGEHLTEAKHSTKQPS